MRKALIAVAAALVLMCGVIATAAPVSVTGILVDQGCYTPDNKGSKAMASCAVECAKRGEPVALVTEKGDVYTVTGILAANKNAKLVPHMSKTVTLLGEVTDAGGKKSIAATALKTAAK